MTILHDAVHISRKRRTCDQCLRSIQPGERYRKQVHTDDGFATYQAHEDCDAAAVELRNLAGTGLNWDEVIVLHEEVGEPESLAWIREHYPAVAARFHKEDRP